MIEVYRTNEENMLASIPPEALQQPDFDHNGCWINLVNPSDKEVAIVSRLSGVEDAVIKAALDDEERSRIEKEDTHVLVLVDIPVIEEEDDYYSYFTIPLGVIVQDDMVITVTLKETAILRDFVRGRIKGFHSFKKTRFLFQILNNVATKYLVYLKQIDKASQRIQNELHKSTKNKELIQMLDLENSLVYFSTSLAGNDAVISRLLNSKGIVRMYEEDTDLLEDVAVDTKQAIEMCSIYRDILSGTMDAYASVISNNLNIVMKILTSVTLVISIPTLVASIFGMNTWVPGEGTRLGFWIVLGISAMLSIGLSFFLRRKKLL